MKQLLFFIVILSFACNHNPKQPEKFKSGNWEISRDTNDVIHNTEVKGDNFCADSNDAVIDCSTGQVIIQQFKPDPSIHEVWNEATHQMEYRESDSGHTFSYFKDSSKYLWPDEHSPTGWKYHGPAKVVKKKKHKQKSSLVQIDHIGSFGSEPAFGYTDNTQLGVTDSGFVYISGGIVTALQIAYSGDFADSVHWGRWNCVQCEIFDWKVTNGEKLLAYKKQDSAMVIIDTMGTIRSLLMSYYVEIITHK